MLIDFSQIPLLYKYNYISLSSKTDNINELLLGNWKFYNISGLWVETISFDEEYLTIGYHKYKWHINENDDKKNPHPFSVKLEIESSEFYDTNPTIIYIDENIVLTNYKCTTPGNDNDKYFFGEVLIKEDAMNLFKSNEDILLYFSKIQNHWEKEKFKTKYKIEKEMDNYDLYIQIPSMVIFIISVVVLFILFDSFLVCFCGFFGLLFLIAALSQLFYTLIGNSVIDNFKKKNPDNRFAQIMTLKLFYKIKSMLSTKNLN